MNKTLSFIFITSVLLGCSDYKNDKRTFTVGFDPKFAPYGYLEGDKYVGFDLDLARQVCEKKQWEFVAKPLDWNDKDEELESGNIDCIWSGFTIQGRENKYAWTVPYIDNSQVVLVRIDSPIEKLTDLKGRTVGVQTDTPVLKALFKGGKKAELGSSFKELKVLPDFEQAMSQLEAGGIDAIAIDLCVAQRNVESHPNKFRILKDQIMFETYGVGFKLGNTTLRDDVEDILRELADDGTMKILAGKYKIDESKLTLWK